MITIWLLERDSNPWSLGYEPNEITTSLPSDITGDFNRIRTYNLLVNSQLLYRWAMKPLVDCKRIELFLLVCKTNVLTTITNNPFGVDNRNWTDIVSLEGWSSTIKLYLHLAGRKRFELLSDNFGGCCFTVKLTPYIWLGRQDSNSQPLQSKSRLLPNWITTQYSLRFLIGNINVLNMFFLCKLINCIFMCIVLRINYL